MGEASKVMASKRLYEKVAQKISAALSPGDYAVGDRLRAKRDLVQQFQVGRQTMREAIIALEIDGYVETVVVLEATEADALEQARAEQANAKERYHFGEAT